MISNRYSTATEVGHLIREFIESMRTPVSKEARLLGYLYETIALKQRYRRCADSWKTHITKCHEATLNAVAKSGAKHTMLVLGSGPLVELPMADLLTQFQRLVLVDFVHPRDVRRIWGRHKRVELLELDLLGIAAPLLQWQRGPLPPAQPPELAQFKADFVLSANCLSQLALKPRQYLQTKVAADELDAYSESLSSAHLRHIKGLNAAHLLIADYETKVVDADGAIVEKTMPFFDPEALRRHDSWNWRLAPRGELYRKQAVEMSVGAFTVV